MKITKIIAAIAASAVITASSMVGMSASAADTKALFDYSTTFEEFYAKGNDAYSTYSIGQSVDAWANALLNQSTTYGQAYTSSTWYNSVSDVELLARIIYAENTADTIDQIAVSWVIVNRKNSSNFPNTFRGVVTQASQFASLNSSNAKNYKDNFKNEGWIHATWLACALLTTSSESDYVSLFGKPQGINSQLYFTGSNYFYNNCQMKNGQLQYHNGNNWVNAYDVVIVGSTLSSSNLIVNKTNVNSHKSSSKNIYFNI